jgi:hypothetical protein
MSRDTPAPTRRKVIFFFVSVRAKEKKDWITGHIKRFSRVIRFSLLILIFYNGIIIKNEKLKNF